MKNIRLIGLLLIAAMCFGACSTHDPVYEDLTPPSTNISKITLCGTVWDKNGNEIQDATISIDGMFSVKTDEHGWYKQVIPNPGTYIVKCYKEGWQPKQADLEAIKTTNDDMYIRNFVLPLEESAEITKDIAGEVQTNVIEGNLNGIVTFNSSVQDLEEDDDCLLTMSPMYDEGFATGYHYTKGPREAGVRQMLLCGVKVTQKKGKKPAKVTIVADLNEETQEVVDILYSEDGKKWGVYTGTINRTDEDVTLPKVPVGYYGFFCDVDVAFENTETKLVITPDKIDNLFGEKEVKEGVCVYEYTSGVVIDTKQGTVQLRALLLELLAADYGLKAKASTHTWYFNQIVKPGWACQLAASQLISRVTYSSQTSIDYRQVEGLMCDKATIKESWYDRKHTGGGSGN